MKLLMLALGPFASYFLVLLYAVIHSTIFDGVLRIQGDVITEYLIILGMYYALCLLGPTFRKFIKRVVSKLRRMYKYGSKR